MLCLFRNLGDSILIGTSSFTLVASEASGDEKVITVQVDGALVRVHVGGAFRCGEAHVRVLSARTYSARFGVVAPGHVSVLRAELAATGYAATR